MRRLACLILSICFCVVALPEASPGAIDGQMGRQLGRLRTGAISRRQSVGAARHALAFPSPKRGARDQSFRMIVKPEIWGREARLRLSNALRHQAGDVRRRLRGSAAGSSAMVAGTNRPVDVRRAGPSSRSRRRIGLERRGHAALRAQAAGADPAGRKLAVSFHIPGESGPMTWHAKALQTSYVPRRAPGAKGADEASRVSAQHHLLVFPRCARHEGAAGRPRHRRVRRFDHRRHALDAERRRSLARRAGAAPACRLRQPGVGGQRRHRRQPGRRARKLLAAGAVPRRTVGAARASNATCSRSRASPR